jgi:hypothetical protein
MHDPGSSGYYDLFGFGFAEEHDEEEVAFEGYCERGQKDVVDEDAAANNVLWEEEECGRSEQRDKSVSCADLLDDACKPKDPSVGNRSKLFVDIVEVHQAKKEQTLENKNCSKPVQVRGGLADVVNCLHSTRKELRNERKAQKKG